MGRRCMGIRLPDCNPQYAKCRHPQSPHGWLCRLGTVSWLYKIQRKICYSGRFRQQYYVFNPYVWVCRKWCKHRKNQHRQCTCHRRAAYHRWIRFQAHQRWCWWVYYHAVLPAEGCRLHGMVMERKRRYLGLSWPRQKLGWLKSLRLGQYTFLRRQRNK